MSPEQQSFIDFIATQPWDDEACHLVYADWLEEHDMLDEAKRQRQYVPSMRWLRKFSEDVFATYEEIIQAGEDTYTDIHATRTVGGPMGFSARDAMDEKSTRYDFWNHWAIITGKPITDELKDKGVVFDCCNQGYVEPREV